MDISNALVNLRDDLKTWTTNNLKKKANESDLAKYLPLTGGTLSNNISVKKSGEQSIDIYTENDLRKASFGLSVNGDAGIYDFTKSQWIITSKTDGTVHTVRPTDDANDTQVATTAWTRGQIANGSDINKVTIDLTDTSKYDESTYYPVYGSILGMARNFRLTCTAVLYNSGTPSWCKHDGGFFATVDILDCGTSWSSRTSNTIILDNDYSMVSGAEPKIHHPIRYEQLHNSSTPVFYVRGGGKYVLNTDYACTWTICTSTITIREQELKPKAKTDILTTDEMNPHAIVLKGDGQVIYPSYLEFTGTSGGNHGGVIDFHFNGSSDDYTARIAELYEKQLYFYAANSFRFNDGLFNMKSFEYDDDVLTYAEDLLNGFYPVAFTPISVKYSGDSGSNCAWSSGFITCRSDTCTVVIFNYNNGKIYTNCRSRDGSWKGWKSTVMVDNSTLSNGLIIKTLTQAEYDSLSSKDPNTIYLTT